LEGDETLPAALAHAEMVAILNAYTTLSSKNLGGCVLYTTVEPCFMCSYLIRVSSISRVVYGTVAGETGGASSNYPILSSSTIAKWKPIIVIGGVLADECASLLHRK
jgi:tRNA(adenine34) deaminase